MSLYYVQIRNRKTGEIVKRMGPLSGKKADQVYAGALINLNHDEYELTMEDTDDATA